MTCSSCLRSKFACVRVGANSKTAGATKQHAAKHTTNNKATSSTQQSNTPQTCWQQTKRTSPTKPNAPASLQTSKRQNKTHPQNAHEQVKPKHTPKMPRTCCICPWPPWPALRAPSWRRRFLRWARRWRVGGWRCMPRRRCGERGGRGWGVIHRYWVPESFFGEGSLTKIYSTETRVPLFQPLYWRT